MVSVRTSPTGWLAEFFDPTDKPHGWDTPVEAFTADGVALVVDPKRAQLVPAKDMPNFSQLIPCSRDVRVIPAAADLIAVGRDWQEPVVGWLIGDDGRGVPLTADLGSGLVDDPSEDGGPYTLVRRQRS